MNILNFDAIVQKARHIIWKVLEEHRYAKFL